MSGEGAAPERVELGPGYRIPRLIHGGWQLSEGHRLNPTATSRERVIGELVAMVDRGFDTFDCADIYTGVEILLGEVVARRPGQVQVHTKCVPDLDVLPTISRAYVERLIDRSLRRLRLERLDLVQFHWWDFAIPGHVETVSWLADLQRAGKIRLLGVTNYDSAHLEELLAAGLEVASHQVQYSLLDKRPAGAMAELCARRGVALLCYGTLAGGFLTDRYLGRLAPLDVVDNRSLIKYRLIIEEAGGWSRFQMLLSDLDDIARRHGASVANVALRAVLDQPCVAAAIVGCRDAAHLGDNLRAFALELSPADRALLAELFAQPGPKGDVYVLEREREGRHAAIMRYGLNAAAGD
jgi:aryl-alcohol dehydrogenase-like predicted oxidoreductase